MKKSYLINRDMYKNIKRMDHRQMENFLEGIYKEGVKDGKGYSVSRLSNRPCSWQPWPSRSSLRSTRATYHTISQRPSSMPQRSLAHDMGAAAAADRIGKMLRISDYSLISRSPDIVHDSLYLR